MALWFGAFHIHLLLRFPDLDATRGISAVEGVEQVIEVCRVCMKTLGCVSAVFYFASEKRSWHEVKGPLSRTGFLYNKYSHEHSHLCCMCNVSVSR